MARNPAFPLVYQHEDACCVRDGEQFKASTLPAMAVVLTARGADRILVPTPHELERGRAEEGMADLPTERRNLVQFVDQRGATIRKVRTYLEPLKSQAQKWPEDAFIGFVERFLYEAALATEHGTGVLSSSSSVVRDFVPIIDPNVFSGEARFRLAEIARLICSYSPCTVEHGSIVADAPTPTTARCLEIMELAEFRALVAESGRLGYIRDPVLAFRRLSDRLRELLRKPIVKPVLAAATTAADAVGAGELLGGVATAADLLSVPAKARDFRPPFISLGPARLGLYRAVVQGVEGAASPPGTIMAFEASCLGAVSHSWLSEGEEEKLEREAKAGIERRRKKHLQAQAALASFGAA